MPLIKESPLDDMTVGDVINIQLSDNAVGYQCDIPPGSILPPGIFLEKNGVLHGVPTIPGQYRFLVRERIIGTDQRDITEYIVNINRTRNIDTSIIEQLIAKAFDLKKVYPDQKVWFEKGTDDLTGQTTYKIVADDNGQIRTIASIGDE